MCELCYKCGICAGCEEDEKRDELLENIKQVAYNGPRSSIERITLVKELLEKSDCE